MLRDELGLRGSRFGCGTEQCGACMVLIDGEPAYSCAREIASVAGNVGDHRGGPCRLAAQQSFLDEQAGQCGYCLSGILISATALTRAQSAPEPRRDRRRARPPSLPLRRAQPHHAGGGPRRRRAGAGMIANTLPQSLIDNPLLSQWISLRQTRGRVRVGSGKVEIGQGIVTALTQIAAEELDVAPEQFASRLGRDRCQSGGGLHLRQLLGLDRRCLDPPRLRRGARAVPGARSTALGCPIAELTIVDGKFLRRGNETGHDYWSLAGDDRSRSPRHRHRADQAAVAATASSGTSLPRLDLPAKLAGAAFIHDIAPANVVHARVLRQPWRGARLVALDEAAVRRAAPSDAIEILREGDLVAFTGASEIAVMRAAEAARGAGALGRRHAGAGRHRHAFGTEGTAARCRTVETGLPGRRPRVAP